MGGSGPEAGEQTVVRGIPPRSPISARWDLKNRDVMACRQQAGVMCCKRFIGLLGVVVLGAGKPLAAQEAGEEKPDQSVPAAEAAPEVTEPVKDAAELEAERLLNEARNLVILLGDDSYRAREDATKGLWDLGEVGIVAIREGAK